MAQKTENVVSMEKELLVRQVTRRGGGQVSGGDQQPAEIATTEQTYKVSNTIHEEATKTSSREERLKKLREKSAAEEISRTRTKKPSTKAKIQRVPFILRDHKNFDKCYEPRVAAVGPLHHGKPKYEQAEKMKFQLAANFLLDSGHTINDGALLKNIEENIKELREFYDEEATKDYDDESLAWMLFVDGCSTLEFIYKYKNLEEEFQIKRDHVAFTGQDLFLLENQLPYHLLKLLMNSSDKINELEDSIKHFVQLHGVTSTSEQKKQHSGTTNVEQVQQPSVTITVEEEHELLQQSGTTITVEKEPTHLLDLLRTNMLGPPRADVPKKGVNDLSAQSFRHPPDLLPPKKEVNSGQSFRHVQELEAAGINFEPSGAGSNSLRDIFFTSGCFKGYLHLPEISVDDSTGPKFMNLIAYEMCPDFQNDFGVTSYIGFLDALIDHADDVKKLRSAGVLHNLLGSDQEVAQLFNEIATDVVPNTAIYRDVKADIERHCKTKWKTWMSQFWHDHFSSPWTILAFLGVLLALGLTFADTWDRFYPPPSP